MRVLIVLLIIAGSLFVGAFYTQLVSYVVLHPYGLHTLSYGQAFAIDLVLSLGGIASALFAGVVKQIVD